VLLEPTGVRLVDALELTRLGLRRAVDRAGPAAVEQLVEDRFDITAVVDRGVWRAAGGCRRRLRSALELGVCWILRMPAISESARELEQELRDRVFRAVRARGCRRSCAGRRRHR
jgi:hypothetical protein